jgi:hypothetical protein
MKTALETLEKYAGKGAKIVGDRLEVLQVLYDFG